MTTHAAPVLVDADFPGGNIIVEESSSRAVHVRQDPRDTPYWWFYWACRVRGAAGRCVRFDFTDGDVLSHHGPAVSWDDGATWHWAGTREMRRSDTGVEIDMSFPESARTARLCLSIPYTETTLRRFLDRTPGLAVDTLCTTKKGRKAEMLSCGCPAESARGKLILTARHHACEMIANYVLEGVLQALTADDRLSDWYQENVAVRAIPFVDKDGVEDGDQGKGRRPRDHNRDYDDPSCHRETHAIRQTFPAWIDGAPTVALDLHCPYIRGPMSTLVYLVGQSDDTHAARQKEFAAMLETCARQWTFRAADLLPFGKGWNTTENWEEGKSCTRWMTEQVDVELASTVEIPYSDVYGTPVTPANARAFGRDLAKSVNMWFNRQHPES